MSPLLSRFLDALGRFPHKDVYGNNPSAAFPPGTDRLKAENLFKIWSPQTQSPWFPYAKATLFASADSNRQLAAQVTGVVSRPFQEQLQNVPSVSWVSSGIGIIADLPQDESVIAAEFFARRYGFQPVALFNNWPHKRGVVNCEVVLAGLMALASQMASVSRLNSESLPLFMAESGRLGNRQPNENDFDNRFFFSEEDLPPGSYLKQHGIGQIYYLYRDGRFNVETDDLNPYFCALAKEGIQLCKVSVSTIERSEPFQPEARKTVLSSFSLFENSAFRRAAAGGFGALVPPRSSGG